MCLSFTHLDFLYSFWECFVSVLEDHSLTQEVEKRLPLRKLLILIRCFAKKKIHFPLPKSNFWSHGHFHSLSTVKNIEQESPAAVSCVLRHAVGPPVLPRRWAAHLQINVFQHVRGQTVPKKLTPWLWKGIGCRLIHKPQWGNEEKPTPPFNSKECFF